MNPQTLNQKNQAEGNKYIGPKKIESTKEIGEKTPSGFSIIEVEYEDKTVEWISYLMFEKIVSDEPCDLSQLREKRLNPIIQVLLAALRDWGIKLNELPYMSVLLNQSLEFNQKEALIELWSKWMPRPLSPDDVDMVGIDRVLRSVKRITIDDILNPNENK